RRRVCTLVPYTALFRSRSCSRPAHGSSRFANSRHQRGRLGWLEAVRRSKDPTVFTVLFEDSAALIGLVIALIGIALAEILEMPRSEEHTSELQSLVYLV